MRKADSRHELGSYDALLLGVYDYEEVDNGKIEVGLGCESPVLALAYRILDNIVEDAET